MSTPDLRTLCTELLNWIERASQAHVYGTQDLITRASAALAQSKGEGPILRWTKNMPPSEGCRYDHCIAETPFGRFLISWKGWKQFDSPTVDETPWGDWYDAFNSVDEAKAACQREMDERLSRWGRPAAPPAPEPAPKPRNPTMDEVLDLAKSLRLEVNDCDALLWLVVTAIAAWGDASAALPGPGEVEA